MTAHHHHQSPPMLMRGVTENDMKIAEAGGLRVMVELLTSTNEEVLKHITVALANLTQNQGHYDKR